MWIYQKKLEYPVRVGQRDLRMAKFLFSQFGGPDGELTAAVRYLTQRYTMPTGMTKAVLTDIGTEELAHWEMISTMIYQLVDDATVEELEAAGLGAHYAEFGRSLQLHGASGQPFTSAYYVANADPIADLTDDMAAEQRARATYDHLLALTDDPDLADGLRFLREREVVQFQRFGEALDSVQAYLDEKHVF